MVHRQAKEKIVPKTKQPARQLGVEVALEEVV